MLYQDEIKRIFNTYKKPLSLTLEAMAKDASDKREGRSINESTYSDFLAGKSNISIEENKKAMIHIYNELLTIERLAKKQSLVDNDWFY